MTRTETQKENVGFAAVHFATPGEARMLLVDDVVGGVMTISYTPACSSVDNVIVYGPLQDVAVYGYTGQECSIGNSGSHAGFDPGSGSVFFMIVANDGSGVEGSYGLDSSGVERPEDSGDPTCSLVQDLSQRCD